MKTLLFFLNFLPLVLLGQQDSIIVGPMKGYSDTEQAIYWLMLEDKSDGQRLLPDNLSDYFSIEKTNLGFLDQSTIDEESIQFGSQYTVKVKLHNPIKEKAKLKKEEKIHFLIGSCHYPHEGKKAERRNSIFAEMQEKDADFMIWLGDNTYYQNSEWENGKKMFEKWRYSRTRKYTAEFLESLQHYAIWDDHDYGPNNSHGDYERKDSSLIMFKSMWPSAGLGTEEVDGVFHKFTKGDIDFFMLDGRYHSKAEIQMFGPDQMNWLKEELKKSTANFKFIMTGNQMIPSNKLGEDWGDFPEERNSFFAFLEEENITGIVLFSGDRHYSELRKMERPKSYSIYEFTCSPLTSLASPLKRWRGKDREKKTYISRQNFGEITVQGEGQNREILISTYNRKGQQIWKKSILLKDLK